MHTRLADENDDYTDWIEILDSRKQRSKPDLVLVAIIKIPNGPFPDFILPAEGTGAELYLQEKINWLESIQNRSLGNRFV
jgi:hypothetical protein